MKKALVVIVALVLLVALTGCVSHGEQLDTVMQLVQGSIKTDPAPPPPDPPVLPEPEIPVDPRDATESAAWPDVVPAPADYIKVYAAVQWEGEFRAHYRMSQKQIGDWQQLLTAAGFSGTPATNGKWDVALTAIESKTEPGMFNAMIVITEAVGKPEWDPAFKVIPPYSTPLPYKSYSINMDGPAMVLEIVVENETKDQVNAYIQQLIAAGFADRGYGFYAKEEGGKTYEFQSDGIWAVETEARLIWRVY